MEPGLYILYLELTFFHVSLNAWNTDYILVNVILPELVVTISGGSLLTETHGTIFTVNASRSNDPVSSLASVMAEPLAANWSFIHYPTTPSVAQRNLFMKNFPTSSLPTGSVKYVIKDGDEYLLTVNSSYFPANTWCAVMFSMVRGARASSVVQWIRLVPNSIPVTLM